MYSDIQLHKLRKIIFHFLNNLFVHNSHFHNYGLYQPSWTNLFLYIECPGFINIEYLFISLHRKLLDIIGHSHLNRVWKYPYNKLLRDSILITDFKNTCFCWSTLWTFRLKFQSSTIPCLLEILRQITIETWLSMRNYLLYLLEIYAPRISFARLWSANSNDERKIRLFIILICTNNFLYLSALITISYYLR